MKKLDLRKENKAIHDNVYAIEEKICAYMREHGLQHINLRSEENEGNDKIYAYDYDWNDDDRLRELLIVAVRLHTDDTGKDYLGIIAVPEWMIKDETFTDEEIEGGGEVFDGKFEKDGSEEDNDKINLEDWEYTLFGGTLLGWFTAINLAECIFEYVEDGVGNFGDNADEEE